MDWKNQGRNTIRIKNQICNQTCVKYIRTHLLGLCQGWFSLEKSIYLPALVILSYFPTHFSPILQPTLYKFIVLGFLGLSSFTLGRASNLVLTLIIQKIFRWHMVEGFVNYYYYYYYIYIYIYIYKTKASAGTTIFHISTIFKK